MAITKRDQKQNNALLGLYRLLGEEHCTESIREKADL